MLEFEPETEEQLLSLLDEGTYDFFIPKAEKHLAKSGNLSIKLTVEVYNNLGVKKVLYCYLSTKYKLLLKHFCDATGHEEAYSSGRVTPEICENMNGRCMVGIEEPEEGSNYNKKNYIKDFLKRDPNHKAPEIKKDEFIDDILPF